MCFHIMWLVLFSSISLRAPVVIAAASIAKTIIVDLKGGGDFKSIQQAIDSVPDYNKKWTKINVAAGVYREKVNVKSTKSYIVLKGDGAQTTSIEWGDYNGDSSGHNTETSATFTSYASNFVAKRITFKNTYNGFANLTPAVAAWIFGDKSAFYYCSFIGFQDTLADTLGRHYFKGCYIEGVADFVFGYGQSIYERCKISTVKSLQKPGYVTAQGRKSATVPVTMVASCSSRALSRGLKQLTWGGHGDTPRGIGMRRARIRPLWSSEVGEAAEE
ncbi:pectinesterase [Musa troglodytarum]|uniref:pectinesterase n=1 Tax=Musa troglodytarum TaxID=320322 RepID=A0A9E7KS83_9LILI|nr:pectinesterase [Musa troglodytarum]